MAAAKPKYAAGLQFIVSTSESDQTSRKQDRRAIRSHAAKAHGKRRRDVQLRSWISPDQSIPSHQITPILGPTRVGSDFAALQLPQGIEPRMVQDLVKLIDVNKFGIYPYEICLDVHPVDRGWFPYMISDLCCLHSMMFSVRAYMDRGLVPGGGGHSGRLAAFHYTQTLQLLQARINAFQQSAIISDTTIMVVITLAAAAEVEEDIETAANHVDGLIKIVNLRGGLRALDTHKNMQVKVCRFVVPNMHDMADLGFALRFGHRPRLFREGIDWECFIADRGMIRCSHEPHAVEVDAFVATLDSRLRNAWRDLHAFSCMSNLAYQTTRKLSPETYNEMIISILYRLAHLSFEDNPLQEATRTGLLSYSASMFMQRQFMQEPYQHLSIIHEAALSNLRSLRVAIPGPVALWFAILFPIQTPRGALLQDWSSTWLEEAITSLGINSWSQAHEILRAVMWVDFIHEQPGMRIFSGAASPTRSTDLVHCIVD